MSLDRLVQVRRTGDESFHSGGTALGFALRNFWQWSASDLVSNTMRGVLAEFLVAQAVGVADGVRVEWDAVDLRTARGTTIEVKASGYLQSWKQSRLATPSFDISPKRGWDAATNASEAVAARSAHVYVFALHHHKDKLSLDILDLAQWSFFVLPTSRIDEAFGSKSRVRLASLEAIARSLPFGELGQAVARLGT